MLLGKHASSRGPIGMRLLPPAPLELLDLTLGVLLTPPLPSPPHPHPHHPITYHARYLATQSSSCRRSTRSSWRHSS